jgi:hypothetical protein
LLVAAGAGTGKTKVLAHRVAHLILNGRDPQRLLLLTFTLAKVRRSWRRSWPSDEQAKIAGGNTARVYNFDVARLTVPA